MSAERADRLAGLVAEEGLDQLIVGDLVRPGDSVGDATANIRWLTGFTGSSALVVIGPETRVFVTDFRYTEQAEPAGRRGVRDRDRRQPPGAGARRAARRARRFRRRGDQRRQPAQARGRAGGGDRADRRRRAGRAASPAQGRGRGGDDRGGRQDHRRRLRARSRRRARRAQRARGRGRRPRAHSRARRRALVPGDRRRGSERCPPARGAVGSRDRARRPGRLGHGRDRRRLLLGLHPHVRRRRDRRGRPRGL